MSLRIGETFAGYRVLRLLGSGGMGEVYLVQHPRLPRQDALKVLRPDLSADASFRERFIREADLAAGLRHPHIVGVQDRGEHNGRMWIAMDYVDGIDAAELIQQRYPAGMPTKLALSIITGVASALDYAHKKGLLHRDVKPANIIVSDIDSADPQVFLADFGIARPLDDNNGITTTNMTVGTVAYAAPEQLMGEQLDGRSDQYALAATAFHLLTGIQLFAHSNPVAVISQHLTEPPPTPSVIRADLTSLDGAFARALAKKPEDRFPRCQDFARSITEAAERSGAGYSPSAPTRHAPVPRDLAAVKSNWRPPTSVTLTVVALLGLGVGVVLLWHPWIKQDRVQISPPAPTTTASPPPTTTMVPLTSSTPAPAPAPSTQTNVTPSRPTYPLAGALGSGCSPSGGRVGTGPDGATYYCARIQFTDGFEWSLTPGDIPNPHAPPPYTPPPASELNPAGPAPMDRCTVPGAVVPGTLGLMECSQLFGGGWFWGVVSR